MKKSWLLLLIIMSFAGCKGPKVVTYLNEEANYQSFDSYYLLNLKGRRKSTSDNIIPKLESLIQQKMEERGYKLEKEEPDLILRYELIASTETDFSNTGSPYSTFNYVTINSFNTSILLFEMRDREKDKLVWHASIDMQNHQEVRKQKDPLKTAVDKIFNTFLYEANSASPNQNLEK